MRPRLALIVLALYLVLALTSAASKAPWVDEGWFASPAYNLITHGHMATHVLEPAGTWLEGIDHYTYWIMPADILAQAAWYKVFGFNLFTMRALSVAWGLFALAALYWVVRHLTNDARLAALAAALLALDYGFVQFTSSGRMDAICVATGLAGLAAYLSLRRRSLVAAVLASQAFVALSGLTHPLGLLPFLGLLYLTLRLDRRRLRWRHALWAVAPYVAGVLAWGVYIAQAPRLFLAQFGGNINGIHGADRGWAFTNPLQALSAEPWRYLDFYGLGSESVGLARFKILLLATFVAALLGCFAARKREGERELLALTLITLASLFLFEGHKNPIYLIHVLPYLTLCLAVALRRVWERWPRASACLVVCYLLAQVSGVALVIWRDEYRRDFLPVVGQLRSCDGLVMGSAELAFGLGFDSGLVDDWRLGYHSGKRPDVVVMGKQYDGMIAGLKVREPEAYEYAVRLLSGYETAFEGGAYRVLVRRGEKPCS